MEITYKENIKGYKVLTPDGYKSFAGIRCLGERPIYKIEFTNKSWLECTDNHKLFVNDITRTPISQLVVGDFVLSKHGSVAITSISDTGKTQLVYDLVEVDGGYRYYTNGLLSSNCEFIRDEETLISPVYLIDMVGTNPIERQGQIRWYSKPRRECTYAIGLDPSLGTGGDPAAIQVLELPSCRQVAEWQHNKTPIPGQIKVLKEICNYIYEQIGTENNIYYSVENNTIGEAALISIAELGEENIRGVFLSEPARPGNARRYRKGFTTTNKSKIAVCAKFKTMVESGKLKIMSSNLISELKNFVALGGSFEAKIGETDDLVLAMLLTVRITQVLQSFDSEIDSQFRDNFDEAIEPMPFIMLS